MPFYLEKPQSKPVKIEVYDPEKLKGFNAIKVRLQSFSRDMRHFVIVALECYDQKFMGQLDETEFNKLACDTGDQLTLTKTARDL